MMKAGKLTVVLLMAVSLTGCWNLQEPDEMAFVLGSGLDYTKDGQVQLSSQIVIPSGIGGEQNAGGPNMNSFLMMKATGTNIYDAVQNLQKDISRTLFFGHRQSILIGHRLAVHGIGEFLDVFVRNPESELRSSIFVVKNAEAKDIFTIKPIFDPIITPSLSREIQSVGLKPNYFRVFLSEAMSQSTQPLLPTISINELGKYVYSGAAILNKDDDLKLVGYLDAEESLYANWISGKLNRFTVTASVRQGEGDVSVNLQSLNHRTRVKLAGKQINVDIRLSGKGTIVENNSLLDPTKRRDLKRIEDTLNKVAKQSVEQLIEKVQKQYKADIFGFGKSVHEQHPVQWKTLDADWKELFPRLRVTVKVDIQCKDPGQSSSSLKKFF